ncbi:EamA family transporter, partial [Richelia intracellularis]|uniref:EamA family transporter n=1 Tax=Richelia intracellularis TaxID=1164990 RepID=UPI0005C564A1
MQILFPVFRFSLSSLFLILPFFLWGTTMVVMKGVLAHTTPLFMAGLRLIPAGVLILVAAAFMGKSQPQGWNAW